MLTKGAVLQMEESDLRQKVIVPLMEAMGFRDVFETHGSRERGKDVVGWKEAQLGSREYTAVVAKAKRFSGSSAAGDVAKQVNQAFNSPAQDPRSLEERAIHRVWVVVNKPLKLETREQIRDQIDLVRRHHVDFLDGDELWRQIDLWLPTSAADIVDEAQRELEALDTSYGVEVSIAPGEKRIVVRERSPGQLDNEPLTITGTLRFPDTPEGQSKREQYQAHRAKGTPVDLPGEYVDFQLPSLIDQLTEQVLGIKPEKLTSLLLTSAEDPRRFPVCIEIECDDGDTAKLPYVEWRVTRAGSEELTLSNDQQSLPILVTQIVNLKSRAPRLSIVPKETAVAAPVLLDILHVQRCFAKPCQVRVTMLETGLPLVDGRRNAVSFIIDPEWVQAVADLAAIQDRVGQAILIPLDRDFTLQEEQTITKLRRILRDPVLIETWNYANVPRRGADALAELEALVRQNSNELVLVQAEEVTLFGATFSLGVIRHILQDARLANEVEIREQLAAGVDDDAEIQFRFVPGDNSNVVSDYSTWGSAPKPSEPVDVVTS